jgi:hypothetical protein
MQAELYIMEQARNKLNAILAEDFDPEREVWIYEGVHNPILQSYITDEDQDTYDFLCTQQYRDFAQFHDETMRTYFTGKFNAFTMDYFIGSDA